MVEAVLPHTTPTVPAGLVSSARVKTGRLWAGLASLVAPGIGPGERGAKPRPEINGSSTAEERGFGTVGRVGDLLGYARVSTGDQRLDLQLDALKGVGCQRVWSDTASGSLTERPELAEL